MSVILQLCVGVVPNQFEEFFIAEQNDPPGSPNTDEAWRVGDTPTGDWVGQAGKLATWNGSSWDYTTLTPQDSHQEFLDRIDAVTEFSAHTAGSIGTPGDFTYLAEVYNYTVVVGVADVYNIVQIVCPNDDLAKYCFLSDRFMPWTPMMKPDLPDPNDPAYDPDGAAHPQYIADAAAREAIVTGLKPQIVIDMTYQRDNVPGYVDLG